MDIFEMIEEAKKSDYGITWFSEKGEIHISKEGNLKPIKLKELPKYQPERSKREDSSRMKKFKESGLIGCLNKSEITSSNYKQDLGCGALNTMET